MQLGGGLTLNINVKLFRQLKDELVNYHREYSYYNETHHSDVSSIKLNFNYYLSLENIYDSNIFLMITWTGLVSMCNALDTAFEWWLNNDNKDYKTFQNNYQYIDREALAAHKVSYFTIQIGKYEYTFEPILITYPNGDKISGIRITLPLKSDFIIDLTYDTAMMLKVFLSRCDMYALAQGLINYINRPAPGTNEFKMNPVEQSQISHTYISRNNGIDGIRGRTIGKDRNEFKELE
jgi:hypothetical protein